MSFNESAAIDLSPPTKKELEKAKLRASLRALNLGEHDVLLGRTKIAHGNPGNKQFRDMIQRYCADYKNASTRDDKRKVSNTIIEAFESQGGRFLVLVSDGDDRVEEVSHEYRYEKVSHALRSARPKKTAEPSPTAIARQKTETVMELRRRQKSILKKDWSSSSAVEENKSKAVKEECIDPSAEANMPSVDPLDAFDPDWQLDIDEDLLDTLGSL